MKAIILVILLSLSLNGYSKIIKINSSDIVKFEVVNNTRIFLVMKKGIKYEIYTVEQSKAITALYFSNIKSFEVKVK